MTENNLVTKVWNYASVLAQSGIGYTDYVSQLTYLLFLKMDEERTDLLKEESLLPIDCRWSNLLKLSGTELSDKYQNILDKLSKQTGIIGTIYKKASNKISNPANLSRLISLINGETWMGLDIDVKGEIYEGLLQKNAQESKAGAGQYFTPRPLIRAMVEVMRPTPETTVVDPACGTGGFLLIAYEYVFTRYRRQKFSGYRR